ncbi:RNA demethylase alkbh9b [Ancistrocladus abbreviatus]
MDSMTDLRCPADDPFLLRYQASELRIASEFLTTWLPFLSKGLCHHCIQVLSDRVHSLSPEVDNTAEASNSGENSVALTENDENCDTHSLGSWKDEAEMSSLSSGKDGANGWSDHPPVANSAPAARMSWADMAQEDELAAEEDSDGSKLSGHVNVPTEEMGVVERMKTKLSRDQREYIRFMNVKRKKDFICLERVNGKPVNILQGLELHTGVFSAAEQKRIVDFIYDLQEMGQRGELKERTYSAPRKWMRGKGRQTLQFGCCYNYATDKNGNPPGILQNEVVDPVPPLFKVIIRRLVRWHVLPPSCVPDSCIVNIYEEGDCIPPHIDNHDFVRPFCTISFLSECNIVFGMDLKAVSPGDFSGSFAIPLPVGSVLVLNGNGADLAKHCVPAVPTKRVSITFRRMDESKRPIYYAPEPDLQGLEPLHYEDGTSRNSTSQWQSSRQTTRRGFKSETRRGEEPRNSSKIHRGSVVGSRARVNIGN